MDCRYNWSISRSQVLKSCERKYYFEYLSPGKTNSRDKVLREIAILKKVTNASMWRGKCFHSIIASYLKSLRKGTYISIPDIFACTIAQMDEQWRESQAYSYEKLLDGSTQSWDDKSILIEHLEPNGYDLSLDNIINEIRIGIEGFSKWMENSGLEPRIKGCSRVWIEPSIFEAEAPGFQMDDTWIITKVDLALEERDGRFDIYDWKTSTSKTMGKSGSDDAEFQRAVYQLWPHITLYKPLELISANSVFFGKDATIEIPLRLDENLRDYYLVNIRKSVSRMKKFNELQLGKCKVRVDGNHNLTLDDLDYAGNDYYCLNCHFKHLCQRELQ